MQTIYLDISNKGVIPCVQAKQSEVGRKFLAVITDNGVPYNIPDNSLLSVWYEGDTDAGNYSSIEEKSAFSIDGNKVVVELVAQMLLKPGKGALCLSVTHGDGGETNTWNIPYEVEYKPGAGSSVPTEYYTALTEAGAYAAEQATIAKRYADQAVAATENKLDLTGGTMAGDIAMDGRKVTGLGTPIASGDAVPLGYALGAFLPAGTTAEQIGAAPSGYGLGVQKVNYVTSLTQLDTIFENGWYVVHLKNDGEHISGASAGLLCVDACQLSAKQTFLYYGSSWRLTRTWHNSTSTWSEWEWVNPPMQLGQEYRTTERWDNKPVYTQVVNCGFAPNVSYKNIAFPYSVIRCSGFCDAGNGYTMSLPVNYGNSGTIVSCHHQSGNIIVYSNDNSSAYTVYAQVWYVKD